MHCSVPASGRGPDACSSSSTAGLSLELICAPRWPPHLVEGWPGRQPEHPTNGLPSRGWTTVQWPAHWSPLAGSTYGQVRYFLFRARKKACHESTKEKDIGAQDGATSVWLVRTNSKRIKRIRTEKKSRTLKRRKRAVEGLRNVPGSTCILPVRETHPAPPAAWQQPSWGPQSPLYRAKTH